jgi:hypothetical protein
MEGLEARSFNGLIFLVGLKGQGFSRGREN